MNWFKKKFYGFVFFRTSIGEILTIIYSMILHLRHSFNDRNPGNDKLKLQYYIAKNCHIVEKGLALPEPRKGFGRPKIMSLIEKTKLYEQNYGESELGCAVRDTLREYLCFHSAPDNTLDSELREKITQFLIDHTQNGKGGLKMLTKIQWNEFSLEGFEKFLKTRHSVRDFSTEPIDESIINLAIKASLNTPSVCNRQGWKVHYYSRKNKIKILLQHQNGNAGFTDSIDKLIIITATINAFTRYEHNQLFTDGGLFAMNLMLALHAAGLGSCPLNTCMPYYKEDKLKEIADIPKQERLIMMIGIGNLKNEFKVAHSEKYPLEQILNRH